MKNFVSTSLIVIAVGMSALALPTSTNFNTVHRRDNSAGAPQIPAWLVAYLTGAFGSGSNTSSNALQPAASQATAIYASPPAAGVNVGGSGGKPGSITTSVPATSGGETVTVPAGASISVTGENGTVSTGQGDLGNGGSVVVNAGKGAGDSSSSTDGASDAGAADDSSAGPTD